MDVAVDMGPKIIEIRTASHDSPESEVPRRRSVIAGPAVRYLLAGLSIIISLYLFLPAHGGDESSRHEVALFIGLWAPMFGILGLRAEILEMREDCRGARRR